MYKIRLNDNTVKYILLQRTELLVLTKKRIVKFLLIILSKVLKKDIFQMMINFECLLRKNSIKRDYIKCINEEYNSIKNYLPLNIENYIDIGCGIGIINIFIKEKLNENFKKLYLIDKTEMDSSIHYGFENTASYYNSMELANKTLIDNGFDKNKIETIEPKENNIYFNFKFDFALSLIAWGFHFPVNTYLQSVFANLNDGGCIILDIRKGTNGMQELKNVFKEVKVIKDFIKYSRVLCIK